MPKSSANKESIGQFYDDRYSGDYMDTDAYSRWGHGDLRTQQVAETLRSVKNIPASVLDYGCGVGGWIDLLARTYPNAKISGIDVSSVAVSKARIKFPNCDLRDFDGIKAPFEDEAFDLIYTYHVLEHVTDFTASVRDISRMLKPGGHAVVIFPCGNEGSFLDRSMKLLEDAFLDTLEGSRVLKFEVPDGHVRRMTSKDTTSEFTANGLLLAQAWFSGHFFGTVDWLCRGTGKAYINRVFAGTPVSASAKMRVQLTRRAFLTLNRLISLKSLDTKKRRNPLKQVAVMTAASLGRAADRLVIALSRREWNRNRCDENGTAQYLIFQKV